MRKLVAGAVGVLVSLPVLWAASFVWSAALAVGLVAREMRVRLSS